MLAGKTVFPDFFPVNGRRGVRTGLHPPASVNVLVSRRENDGKHLRSDRQVVCFIQAAVVRYEGGVLAQPFGGSTKILDHRQAKTRVIQEVLNWLNVFRIPISISRNSLFRRKGAIDVSLVTPYLSYVSGKQDPKNP